MIRNVLLLIADDWSPIAGCYGNAVIHTPNIDRLAQCGTRFTRAFCTTPTCSASRANLLTGLYGHQHRQYGHTHGVHHFRTRSDAVTLPAILRKSGITSALIGKSHIAPKEVYPFDVWQEPADIPFAKFSNSKLRALTETFLKDIGDNPFYLHVASSNPHRAGGEFIRPLHPEFEGKDTLYGLDEVAVPSFLPDTPETRRDLADYYTYISRFDEHVGSILGELERSGHSEDTLILLMSDHGMPFPGAKASPFESGHHCPLIIVHPNGIGAGKQCDALVNWSDILPTVIDAMGVSVESIPDGCTGRSLMPLLKDSHAPWRDSVFYVHNFHEITNYFPYRVVRGNRYKYIRCLASQLDLPLGQDLFDSPTYKEIERTGGSEKRSHERLLRHWPEALFDLDNDPEETINLIDDTKLQPLIQDYRNRLQQFLLETKDPWLEVDYQQGRIRNYR
ncbi:sulfatase [Ruficoccus amylovorans]|uniref:Sulfatase n=1 Tax=Ruficoccus amylovorans TaxID=1804625 RepID=A0A842HG16_9BACT|nr:sulfatase [Ruficoccus amylovorans]MBC2594484.1 sulfatase [Ruficoccus amylovorans]